jgi:hypothetical protein
MLPPRRWRAAHLLGAWILYWVVLAAVVLWRPALVARRISRLPEGHSNAGLSFGNGGFDLKMVADGATAYQGHASYTAVVLWLVLPPLLFFLLWLALRPRPEAPRPAELGSGDPLAGRRDRAREDVRR